MEPLACQAGTYLTFRVARHEFAMCAGRVRGILPASDLLPAGEPTVADPPWLAGFAKLRGRVLPVIDLRGKLGLRNGSRGRQPCIIVIEAGTPDGPRLAGFVADRLSEIITARARDFRYGKLRIGRPRIVLDADAVLSEGERHAPIHPAP